MCNKPMNLSLEGEAFAPLKKDFDNIIERTIGNMQMKATEEAVITVKLSVSLEKSTVSTADGVREIIKPMFKHDVSSVMQLKDKATGQSNGKCKLEWDEDEGRYVLKDIDDDQISMFDKDGNVVIDGEYEECDSYPELHEAERPALEAPEEEIEEEQEESEAEEESSEDDYGYEEPEE